MKVKKDLEYLYDRYNVIIELLKKRGNRNFYRVGEFSIRVWDEDGAIKYCKTGQKQEWNVRIRVWPDERELSIDIWAKGDYKSISNHRCLEIEEGIYARDPHMEIRWNGYGDLIRFQLYDGRTFIRYKKDAKTGEFEVEEEKAVADLLFQYGLPKNLKDGKYIIGLPISTLIKINTEEEIEKMINASEIEYLLEVLKTYSE